MTEVTGFDFIETNLNALAESEGRLALVIGPEGKLGPVARRVNKLTRGALARAVESDRFQKAKAGDVLSLSWPVGMVAEAVDILCLDKRPTVEQARKGGAALARLGGGQDKPQTLCLAGVNRNAVEVVFGLALRGYDFTDHKSTRKDEPKKGVTVMVADPAAMQAEAAAPLAVAKGVFLTRDLVNAPANVLTTSEFADRAQALEALGVTVEILDEDQMRELGMGALLAVGQGSSSHSKIAIMQWNGGEEDDAPLALVGKGVVFDTGGISIKPVAGMQDMTMDMGGAAVVTGVMKTLALRRARANVVGLIGLVENMPSGEAYRPGDVLTSMKGDTIEVITTDAEGRLVLCDVMWYAQERFQPAAMIDLATLTGAVIIALGHDNAGLFANNDAFADQFLAAAQAEGEGAWRLPLGPGYAEAIKSRIADIKNSGGRPASSNTAAEFLHCFVKPDMPWIHLDIAGTASVGKPTGFAPAGATGWGVMSLDRLIRDQFES
jgi:leucyl aminopeptidase